MTHARFFILSMAHQFYYSLCNRGSIKRTNIAEKIVLPLSTNLLFSFFEFLMIISSYAAVNFISKVISHYTSLFTLGILLFCLFIHVHIIIVFHIDIVIITRIHWSHMHVIIHSCIIITNLNTSWDFH